MEVAQVAIGVVGWRDPLVDLVDNDSFPGDRLGPQLGEHGPGSVPAADREVEAASGFHGLAGSLGHERSTGASHGRVVSERFELVVHGPPH